MKRLLPFCASDTLQLIELLFRVSPRFCIVDKLVHQTPFPMRTWKIVGACGTERRGSREDRPNLTEKEVSRARRTDGIFNTYRKVFWQAFDAFPFAIVFPVESFGV